MGGAPSKILDDPPVFLGGKDVLTDDKFFEDNKIRGVVSLGDICPSKEMRKKHNLLVRHYWVDDSPNADLSQCFVRAAEFIQKVRCDVKVLKTFERCTVKSLGSDYDDQWIVCQAWKDAKQKELDERMREIEELKENNDIETDNNTSVEPPRISYNFNPCVSPRNVEEKVQTYLCVDNYDYITEQQRNPNEHKAVYIHCQAGISRSTTTLLAYMMCFHKLDWQSALGHVHRIRDTVCPNQGFRHQLTMFWENIKDKDQARMYEQIEFAPWEVEESQEVVKKDFEFIAKTLKEAEEKAMALKNSKYVYRSTGNPVPKELEEKVFETTDGNGLMARMPDGRNALVIETAEYLDTAAKNKESNEENHQQDNFGLADFEGQKEKLKKLFAGREAEAGGAIGLEWLMDKNTDSSLE